MCCLSSISGFIFCHAWRQYSCLNQNNSSVGMVQEYIQMKKCEREVMKIEEKRRREFERETLLEAVEAKSLHRALFSQHLTITPKIQTYTYLYSLIHTYIYTPPPPPHHPINSVTQIKSSISTHSLKNPLHPSPF